MTMTDDAKQIEVSVVIRLKHADTVLCRNDLPSYMRNERSASNKCHTEVVLPNEGGSAYLICPNCLQVL